jgi:hypothetical protein
MTSLSKGVRIGLAASLLALSAAYVVVGATRKAPGPLVPPTLHDMAPDKAFQFKCPEGWTCPDLKHPGGWVPPEEKRPPEEKGDEDYLKPVEIRI